ncbi:MAG: DUF3592 domain-containing protein, partial [Thermoanaerobaculia bacterium]
ALRYATAQGETVSIASAAASALQFGSPTPAQTALENLPRGESAPCWFDPDDPKQVVLDRSPGAGYLFALIPFATLIAAVAMLKRAGA